MITRVLALTMLGLRAAVHFLLRPLRSRALADRHFVRQFLDDDLLPITGASRDLYAAAARCTGCGLCDALCALEGRLTPGSIGPSFVARALTRSTPDLAMAQGDLAVYRDCGECRRCEQWCPYGVPLQGLLDDARATLDHLDRRRRAIDSSSTGAMPKP